MSDYEDEDRHSYGYFEENQYDDEEYEEMSEYEWQQIQSKIRAEMEKDELVYSLICNYLSNDFDKSLYTSCQHYVLLNI
jgi:hypothetical protein